MPDRSPFPGMDPWLESYWNDVHHTVINDLARQIADGLPPGLFVSVEERVYVFNPESVGRRSQYMPDVAVFDFGAGEASAGAVGGAVADPIVIELSDDPVTEGYIEIRRLRLPGEEVVTAVEVLSPTNKGDPAARADYVGKRDAYHRAGVNVVELDLLRAGPHLVDVPPERLDRAWATPYKCVVRRGGSLGRKVDYYPLPLRRRLSRIRVPLRAEDPPVIVDLQSPIDEVYRRGRYGQRIDYARPLDPPLSPDDSAWAAGCVAAARG